IRLLVEPINTFDIPGFHLNRTAQAIALIEEVGSSNLWLQQDIYHMQRMEGELANTIAKHLPKIAHMQIADNPGRNEPGSGEINYDWLFRFIDQLGYDGWIGCESKPAAGTREGLGWIKALAGGDRLAACAAPTQTDTASVSPCRSGASREPTAGLRADGGLATDG